MDNQSYPKVSKYQYLYFLVVMDISKIFIILAIQKLQSYFRFSDEEISVGNPEKHLSLLPPVKRAQVTLSELHDLNTNT